MTRKVKNADERRRDIIKAARVLFQTKDYEKATMQELMEKLSIARGTIYYYFSSKQEILEAVVEDLVDEELRKKEVLMKSASVRDLCALDKMRVLIEEDHVADDNEQILNNLHHPENAEMHVKQLGRYITKLAPLWASIFSQGCGEGVFTTEHPFESAELILAGIQFLTDRGFYHWDEAQLERRMKAIPFLVEAQLGSLSGSFGFLNEKNNMELVK